MRLSKVEFVEAVQLVPQRNAVSTVIALQDLFVWNVTVVQRERYVLQYVVLKLFSIFCIIPMKSNFF